jgi:hypothetical protein
MIFDGHILPLDEPGLVEAFTETSLTASITLG